MLKGSLGGASYPYVACDGESCGHPPLPNSRNERPNINSSRRTPSATDSRLNLGKAVKILGLSSQQDVCRCNLSRYKVLLVSYDFLIFNSVRTEAYFRV